MQGGWIFSTWCKTTSVSSCSFRGSCDSGGTMTTHLSQAPGCLSLEVFQARWTGRRSWGKCGHDGRVTSPSWPSRASANYRISLVTAYNNMWVLNSFCCHHLSLKHPALLCHSSVILFLCSLAILKVSDSGLLSCITVFWYKVLCWPRRICSSAWLKSAVQNFTHSAWQHDTTGVSFQNALTLQGERLHQVNWSQQKEVCKFVKILTITHYT